MPNGLEASVGKDKNTDEYKCGIIVEKDTYKRYACPENYHCVLPFKGQNSVSIESLINRNVTGICKPGQRASRNPTSEGASNQINRNDDEFLNQDWMYPASNFSDVTGDKITYSDVKNGKVNANTFNEKLVHNTVMKNYLNAMAVFRQQQHRQQQHRQQHHRQQQHRQQHHRQQLILLFQVVFNVVVIAGEPWILKLLTPTIAI